MTEVAIDNVMDKLLSPVAIQTLNKLKKLKAQHDAAEKVVSAARIKQEKLRKAVMELVEAEEKVFYADIRARYTVNDLGKSILEDYHNTTPLLDKTGFVCRSGDGTQYPFWEIASWNEINETYVRYIVKHFKFDNGNWVPGDFACNVLACRFGHNGKPPKTAAETAAACKTNVMAVSAICRAVMPHHIGGGRMYVAVNPG